MDKKVIIAIVIVAIIVVAGVCVYFFWPKEQKFGGTEVYSDIKVGDSTSLDFDISLTMDDTETVQISEALEGMYFDVIGIEPAYSQSVSFNDKQYMCDVYVIADDDETVEYYAIQTSGVVLKVETEDGFQKLVSTNCDVTKTISEQDVTVGTTYSYEIVVAIPGLESMMVTGASTSTVTEIGNGGDCKLRTVVNIDEEDLVEVVLESINAGVYKFVDDDYEYTKDGAMSYYAYSCCMNDIIDEYGKDAVNMGKKTTANILTAYGERDVTVQKVEVDIDGAIADVTFYYGAKDVLYRTEMTVQMEDFGELAMSVDLIDSDDVKSL